MLRLIDNILLGTAKHNDDFIGLRVLNDDIIYIGKAKGPSYIDILLSGVSPLILTNALADGLNYLKLFGGTELVPETYIDSVTAQGKCIQTNLPSGYTQVEYLESSGTQYIDTGIVPDVNTKIEAIIGRNSQLVTGDNGIFGESYFGCRWASDSVLRGGFGTTTWQNTTVTQLDRNTIQFGSGNFKYNNQALSVGTGSSFGSNSILLFAITATNKSVTRLYSFTIYQNNVLVRNLIPAKNSSNVLGMYDTVTGNFLTNAGEGTFSAGSDAVPSPDTPMDIVCNNGVLKVSPNLFNKNLVPDVNEYINKTNGNVSSPTSGEFRHSDYIVIKENTQYYVGIITSTANTAGLAFYDDTKTLISGLSLTELGNNNNIITSPNDTKYIRFSFRVDEGYNTNWQNTVYFVEGNQPLAEFMPYGSVYTDGTVEQVTDSLGNTANAERLLAVGSYKDTQEVLSGLVTHNIGIKVFNGTENWGLVSTTRFNCPLPEAAANTERPVFCTHYVYNNSATSGNTCRVANSGNFIVNLDDEFTSADAYKAWLANQYANGTPVIVVFSLEAATTESVSGQFLSKSPVTYAGSIAGLTGTVVESSHTTPSPTQPLDIVCNNGVVKYGYKSVNMFDKNSTLEDGQIWTPGGAIQQLSNYYGTNQIHVIGGHTYTRNGSHGTANYIKLSDGTWINQSGVSNTITMPDNAVLWVFNNTTATSRDTMMVVEGTSQPDEYVPYKGYGIYTDGTVETVEVHGKNLFRGNYSQFNSQGGTGTTYGYFKLPDENSTYTISLKAKNDYTCPANVSIGFTKNGGNASNGVIWAIRGGDSVIAGDIITKNNIGSGSVKYPFVSIYINSVQTLSALTANFDIQIEQGSTATTYEPYFNGGSATAEMLLKVGDYKDVQAIIDGSVTRNIGIKVFDGTENWSTGSATNPNRYTLAAAFNDLADLTDNNIGYSNCYTVISRSTSIQSSLQNNECGWNTTKVFCVRDDRIATLTDWKQFLADQYNAGTPVIIIYPLATSTTESVTAQSLTTQQGDNILEITQASMNGLTMEVSYMAGVTVTITEVENAQLSNNVEVTING